MKSAIVTYIHTSRGDTELLKSLNGQILEAEFCKWVEECGLPMMQIQGSRPRSEREKKKKRQGKVKIQQLDPGLERQHELQQQQQQLDRQRQEIEQQQRRLMETVMRQQEDKKCIICLDNTADCGINCGHLYTCLQCTNQIDRCPICRITIIFRVKMYLS